MQGRVAWTLSLLALGTGCQGMRSRGAEIGRAATAAVNASPELRREIVYVAVGAFKDAAVARFSTYRPVAGQPHPTFYRLTKCDPVQRNAGASVAVISASVHGDGYQNRPFRGRVDFVFDVDVTTPIDFAVDWDGERAIVLLNPTFTAVRVKHDYTPFASVNDLISRHVEENARTELQQAFGGPQRWVIAKVDGKWLPTREPAAK
jgi:hypothetical protein